MSELVQGIPTAPPVIPVGGQEIRSVRADGTPVVYVIGGRVEVPKVEIDPNAPWAGWPTPEAFTCELRQLNTVYRRQESQEPGQQPFDIIALRLGDQEIAHLTDDGLSVLGRTCGFPADFVTKLPGDLATQVINNRVSVAKDGRYTLLSKGGYMNDMTPDWRELMPYNETAQFVYNTLAGVYGADRLDVAHAYANGDMKLRIMTPVQEPITARVGDVLEAGIEVQQNYSTNLEVNLFTRRLVCTNGATVNGSAYRWTQRGGGDRSSQFAWLQSGVSAALTSYDNLIRRARTMAETSYDGDAEDALRERAASMRLPQRLVDPLIAAFNEEPGRTEWDLWNAFTRFATHHGELEEDQRWGIQNAAGNWAAEFELVNARLPRSIANKVGARILEANNN